MLIKILRNYFETWWKMNQNWNLCNVLEMKVIFFSVVLILQQLLEHNVESPETQKILKLVPQMYKSLLRVDVISL